MAPGFTTCGFTGLVLLITSCGTSSTEGAGGMGGGDAGGGQPGQPVNGGTGGGGEAGDGGTNGGDGGATAGGAGPQGGEPSRGGGAGGQGGAIGGNGGAIPDPGPTLPARSVGCGKAANGTGAYVRKDMSIAGQQRSNFIWIPANYDPARAYDLLFTMHGSGGVAPGNGRGIETASGRDAIIMTPQGIGGLWQLGAQGVDMMFFDAMYADAINNLCVNQRRVFVMGFSRGGAMSNLIGCVRGDKIRAIGPLAGWQPAPPNSCIGHPAAWFAHAAQDGAVSIVQGHRARDLQLTLNGCQAASDPVAPAPCVTHRGCRPGAPVVFCEIPGDHGAPIEWSVPAQWEFFAALP